MNSEEVEAFLKRLDEWEPTIVEEVVDHYLSKTGFVCTDKRVKKLISLAAERFISEVAREALQSSRSRQGGHSAASSIPSGGSAGAAAEKRDPATLSIEDLSQALRSFGIELRKPEYISDN